MLFNRFALQDALERTGTRRSALARLSGLSAPYITQILQGDRTNPSYDAVKRWCEVLGVSDPKALYLEPSVDELLSELNEARKREGDVKTAAAT